MNDNDKERESICVRVAAHRHELQDELNGHILLTINLESDVAELTAEIAERRRKLDLIPAVISRPPKVPSIPGVAVGLTFVEQFQRGRLQDEIDRLEARLTPLERNLAEARRLADQAERNLDQTAANYQRHRCWEFPYI